jgi:hypothetical protein
MKPGELQGICLIQSPSEVVERYIIATLGTKEPQPELHHPQVKTDPNKSVQRIHTPHACQEEWVWASLMSALHGMQPPMMMA